MRASKVRNAYFFQGFRPFSFFNDFCLTFTSFLHRTLSFVVKLFDSKLQSGVCILEALYQLMALSNGLLCVFKSHLEYFISTFRLLQPSIRLRATTSGRAMELGSFEGVRQHAMSRALRSFLAARTWHRRGLPRVWHICQGGHYVRHPKQCCFGEGVCRKSSISFSRSTSWSSRSCTVLSQ
ncbi:hypothetical protein BS47DRAFT_183463 [Hydnum rufescens UP504]|uniref:Uncharacterized protein n=1 Tax=Hydnum rufescens UP504 TaxID=1448309 RepID=A0A9P6ANK0_9AGAM|nr:hypothetical protein BS47DRAFT_183463 [Hydnum rufescens UP504]